MLERYGGSPLDLRLHFFQTVRLVFTALLEDMSGVNKSLSLSSLPNNQFSHSSKHSFSRPAYSSLSLSRPYSSLSSYASHVAREGTDSRQSLNDGYVAEDENGNVWMMVDSQQTGLGLSPSAWPPLSHSNYSNSIGRRARLTNLRKEQLAELEEVQPANKVRKVTLNSAPVLGESTEHVSSSFSVLPIGFSSLLSFQPPVASRDAATTTGWEW